MTKVGKLRLVKATVCDSDGTALYELDLAPEPVSLTIEHVDLMPGSKMWKHDISVGFERPLHDLQVKQFRLLQQQYDQALLTGKQTRAEMSIEEYVDDELIAKMWHHHDYRMGPPERPPGYEYVETRHCEDGSRLEVYRHPDGRKWGRRLP